MSFVPAASVEPFPNLVKAQEKSLRVRAERRAAAERLPLLGAENRALKQILIEALRGRLDAETLTKIGGSP